MNEGNGQVAVLVISERIIEVLICVLRRWTVCVRICAAYDMIGLHCNSWRLMMLWKLRINADNKSSVSYVCVLLLKLVYHNSCAVFYTVLAPKFSIVPGRGYHKFPATSIALSNSEFLCKVLTLCCDLLNGGSNQDFSRHKLSDLWILLYSVPLIDWVISYSAASGLTGWHAIQVPHSRSRFKSLK